MKNIVVCLVLCSMIYGSSYYGSTTAPVVIAGGIIKAKNVDDSHKKFKRKDCPVCKGKGWYMSGDGIEKVSCGYCEPDTKEQPSCTGESCKTQIIRK